MTFTLELYNCNENKERAIVMRKNFRILCLVSLMALVLVGCGSKAQQKREITVVGSTALQPMVEMAAEEYQKDNPENILEEMDELEEDE